MYKIFILLILILTSCSNKSQELKELINQKEHTVNETIPLKRENNVKQVENTPPLTVPPKQISEEKPDNTKVTFDTLNFLLLGSDTRGEKVARTDTIIVAQYDPKQSSIKLISFMRDCYVMIPNYKHHYNKLNLAYFLGGKKLLIETLEENFDLTIDYTAVVDFKGFIKIIDTLAPEGVPVNVKADIVKDMNLTIHPGENYLHGNDLLAFVRYRHDSESDFGRVRRQQEVLKSLKNTLQDQLMSFEGLTKLPIIVNESFRNIETDIPLEKLIMISSKMLLNRIDTVDTLRIPVNNSFVDERYEHSGAVLKLDINKNNLAIKEFLSESKPVSNE